MRELLVGFDSAWANKTRGAIAAYTFDGEKGRAFHAPALATFEAAADFINECAAEAEYVLIAIDQPTIVPNREGCRPIDRVAGSLISGLRGGVQPARRAGGAEKFFGDDAPIWRFLPTTMAQQNLIQARTAATGRFLIEVFPALALPAMIPEVWDRHRAAKYNPVARRFDVADWALVASGLATYARKFGMWELADWADAQAHCKQPRKPDQDRLDAAICLAVAISWRRGSPDDAVQLGDEASGYMVTPVSVATRAVLTRAAVRRGVPIDRDWNGATGSPSEPSRQPAFTPPHGKPNPARRSVQAGARDNLVEKIPARVDPGKLRELLVGRAQCGGTITYGAVAAEFGFAWSQGFGASLKRVLNVLADENRCSGEPLLMCLVVNKDTGIPGPGFYAAIGCGSADLQLQRQIFGRERARCREWSWGQPGTRRQMQPAPPSRTADPERKGQCTSNVLDDDASPVDILP